MEKAFVELGRIPHIIIEKRARDGVSINPFYIATKAGSRLELKLIPVEDLDLCPLLETMGADKGTGTEAMGDFEFDFEESEVPADLSFQGLSFSLNGEL